MDREEVERALDEAKAAMQAAADADMMRGDPLAPVMAGIAIGLGAQRMMFTAVHEMLAGPRPPLSESDMAELVEAARQAAERGIAEDRRKASRSMRVLHTCLVGISVLTAGLMGYGIGSRPRAQAEAALTLAFRDGAGAAATWARLMATNDIQAALALCKGKLAYIDQAGGQACLVPLHIGQIDVPVARR